MNTYLRLLKEKGASWFISRSLYSIKLKCMRTFPLTEKLFERKTPEINRIDFFSYDIHNIKCFLESLPDETKAEIVSIADKACKGVINGFSSVELNYGWPIQWQLNPLTGKSCKASDKWYKIPDFDEERGDIKIIWEVSRFTHFFYLARAFLITGESKYVEAYFEQIEDWVKNNRYSYGANYKCGQECSLRLISCLFTYPCFSSFATEKDKKNIKEIVAGSYKKVLSNFFYAHRCIKNNHTISELVGMIIGAWCCSDMPKMLHAYRMLDRVIEEQFSEDGGYIQLSFNYQRLALQDLEIILYASEMTGVSLSEEAKKRILNSALLLYQCQDESGDVPNYGSNDGALILPLTIGGYRDFKPVINTVHVMIEGHAIYEEPYLSEELLWFGMDPNPELTKIERVSTDFKKAGISTLRNKNSWLMVLSKNRIGQMDNGHIDLWVKGKNILCDAGSYSYASELGRELYKNISHNTAYCEGLTQIRRIGAFAVYGQPKLKKRVWSENEIEFDIIFSTGYEHRRKVSITQNGYAIKDEIICDNRKCFIQFHALGNVEKMDSNCIKLDGCLLKFDAPVSVSKSKRSLYYLKEEETTCISVCCNNIRNTIIEITD